MDRSELEAYFLRKRLRKNASKGRSFNFTIQRQEQTNWCWAAVSATVVQYYHNETYWKQCDIVTEALKEDACFGDASAPHINKQWELDKALSIVGCLKMMTDKNVPEEVVFHEIAERRPLGARIHWKGGGGHFVVIRGWFIGEDDALWYVVEDPVKNGGGTRTMPAAKFEKAFGRLGHGSWSHSYFVRDPAAVGA
ncbi:hypothetical protein ELH58_10355 [Rhizobium ruizarguesonis]|uniref:papain-like cysteine protease family protein n=1 Tax=Rhizobium TaxID=379 RepID=UPI00102FABB6|nr:MULTISPECIES: papain-like cysteine protease family protein [Rhizobium]MBB4389359.1 hypothetical protein [Rhizobium leguminosarum]NKL79031.1 hypothetical protein [Rhizobium leguminosarum bv. viciae]TBA68956.1 hypothetical protein ELH58_10355 [Rhizobium ruizarguesonis]